MRILIADHTTALSDHGPGLTAAGHEVRVATEGVAALRLARDWSPELVLVRVDLPGMDGLALAASLRALGRVGSHGLALAGAKDDVHARTRASQLGVGTYLSLPVDQMELVRAVWRAGCRPTGVPAQRQAQLRSKKVG